MKKLFTLLAFLGTMLTGMATEYTTTIVVTINGESSEGSEAIIEVTEDEDGTYTMVLNDFYLISEDSEMAVGNIEVSGVESTEEDGVISLYTEQSITIQSGTDESVTWMGPMICASVGEIPIVLSLTIDGDDLSGQLDIDLSTSLGQVVVVTITTPETEEETEPTYQIPNSDFESFHTASYSTATSDEPDNWHSFMSSTGTFASLVSSSVQTEISDDVRPGSEGSSSVLVKSRVLLGISANGTITTGRMQAGSITATSSDNCAFLDITNEDTDANGDPFYTLLDGTPDSLTVWVKYSIGTRGTSNADYVYASLNAVITDGTYYQDPEEDDEEYTNVVAKATDVEIESLKDDDGEDVWQYLSIPFDYESYEDNGAEVAAILVTISTCAYPGGGSTDSSNLDLIYIDDLKLVYNAQLASLSVNGTALDGFDKDVYEYSSDADVSTATIEAEANGKGASVETDIDATSKIATITVTSQDGETVNTYTVDFSGSSTGISSLASGNENNPVVAIYNINGQKISVPSKGQIYITKYADGRCVKSVCK